jgi:hypothetical protein
VCLLNESLPKIFGGKLLAEVPVQRWRVENHEFIVAKMGGEVKLNQGAQGVGKF